MRFMLIVVCLGCLMCALAWAQSSSAPSPPPSPPPSLQASLPPTMTALHALAGEWISVRKPGGAMPFQARSVYEIAADGRSMTAHTDFFDEHRLWPHGDAQIWVEPKTSDVRYQTVMDHGAIARGTIELVDGKTFVWDWRTLAPDGAEARFRVEVERVDPDTTNMRVLDLSRPHREPPPPIVFRRVSNIGGAASSERSAYAASVAAASSSLRLNDPAAVHRWLGAAPQVLRGWEWRYLQAASDESLSSRSIEGGGVWSVAIRRDGIRAAFGCDDGRVRVLEWPSGKPLQTLEGHKGAVYDVTYSPDGALLGSASADKTARIWSADSGQLVATFSGHTTPCTHIDFSPDGSRAATCNYRFEGGNQAKNILGTVHIWDPRGGDSPAIEKTLSAGIKPCSSVTWSQDGQWLALGSWDGFVAMWHAPFEGEPRMLKLPDEGIYNAVNSVAISPDGKLVACGSKDRTARIWSTGDGEPLATLRDHGGFVLKVEFSPDGRFLASGAEDALVRLWNTGDWKLRATLRGHTQAIAALAWTATGDRLLTADGGGGIHTWDPHYPHYGDLSQKYERTAIYTAQFSPTGEEIASAAYDGYIRIWDAGSGAMAREWKAHESSCNTLSYSADGARLLSCSWENKLKLWNAADGSLIREIPVEKGVYHCALSPDARLAATSIGAFDVETGALRLSFEGSNGKLSSVTFDRSGGRIVTAGRDKTARVWDAADGRELARFTGHTAGVLSAVFAPDGRSVLSSGSDGRVCRWDAASGGLQHELFGGDEAINRVALSPDGRRVAAAGNSLHILDADRGGELLRLRPHADTLWHLSWSPDGQRLATCCWDGTLRVLDSRPVAERPIEHRPSAGATLAGPTDSAIKENASSDAMGG